ncbi:hypothetical protein GCM10022199_01770 [Marihabitans asiaticum]|uniref:WXG100 family type VII secretion target n=1 Tax=Marihabitans asiaticum TaxID=415218 RepID=A0A560WFV7_9MICO|nr:WXG100 family type VII secretion target [Marihabitans asiaticum]TWD16547.1 WXG100 family type VII secretion target [Marihabitans asiaticum]
MANVQQGMNTEAVRSSAGIIKKKAAEIEAKSSEAQKVAGQLKQDWLGNDSDQFQNDWQQAKKKIDLVATELQRFAKAATTQADDQDKRSSNDNG